MLLASTIPVLSRSIEAALLSLDGPYYVCTAGDAQHQVDLDGRYYSDNDDDGADNDGLISELFS